MSADNVLIYSPEIIAIFYILFGFIRLFLYKSIVGSEVKEYLITIIPVYIFAFILGSIWIEYPTSAKNYTFQNGKWKSFDKRILHKPFGFNGYTIPYKQYMELPLDNSAGIKVHYHIDNSDIEPILYKIGLSYFTGFNERVKDDLIMPLIVKLVYITPKEVISDYHQRQKLFKEALEPIGVTVDNVEFIYLRKQQ